MLQTTRHLLVWLTALSRPRCDLDISHPLFTARLASFSHTPVNLMRPINCNASLQQLNTFVTYDTISNRMEK